MPKCLQITGNSAYGGIGYLLLRWCEFLSSEGWQVDVQASDPHWVQEILKIPGIGVVQDIYIPRDISPIHDLVACAKLFSLIRRKGYDLVHTYTATPGLLGRLAARLAGTPSTHHQAGWAVTEFSPLWERIVYTPLEYLAVLASTKTICVSHSDAIQARQLHIAPERRLVTICNGIDPEPFVSAAESQVRQAVRRELGVPDTHLVIGNTGRLAEQKDNETLIRAVVPLQSLLPEQPFTLLLAGKGPQQDQLEDLVHSLGLDGQVQLLGFRSDIPAFLAALDIFVNPSLWEGLSISLLEAMASARPIVTTSILPNAELIQDTVTGLLVPPRDPERVAQAIARYVRDPELADRCGQAARERVLTYYTLDRMFQETWDLYLDLSSGKRSQAEPLTRSSARREI